MDPLLFDKVVAFVRGLSDFDQLAFLSPISASEKLKLYALFKQATAGPCTGARPSFFDMQGKYKYDAWKELGDTSRSSAMAAYVEHVIEYAMSVQSSLGSLDGLNLSPAHRTLAEDLRARVEELKHDCAVLWPQRFAHLRSPDASEVADDIYEKEEVASFGNRDDTSFGTPLILSDDMGIPLPGNIASLLNGQGKLGNRLSLSSSDSSDINSEEAEGDDDPLHVKEPRLAEASTDSLVRRSPVSNELYEMVLASFRRLDSLEESVRRLQQHLDTLEGEKRRRVLLQGLALKAGAIIAGSSLALYILWSLLALRRARK